MRRSLLVANWLPAPLRLKVKAATGSAGSDPGAAGGYLEKPVASKDFLDLLRRLLPPVSYDRNGQNLTIELTAWALALQFCHDNAAGLLSEAMPETARFLLADWERNYGLPDPCVSVQQTFEQRRAALVSKVRSKGGLSKQYFINLAAKLGYPGATINESAPITCNDTCNDSLFSELDKFVWQLNLPSAGGVFVMSCNSYCDSPLRTWGDEVIECRINSAKPAHTAVLFAYSE